MYNDITNPGLRNDKLHQKDGGDCTGLKYIAGAHHDGAWCTTTASPRWWRHIFGQLLRTTLAMTHPTELRCGLNPTHSDASFHHPICDVSEIASVPSVVWAGIPSLPGSASVISPSLLQRACTSLLPTSPACMTPTPTRVVGCTSTPSPTGCWLTPTSAVVSLTTHLYFKMDNNWREKKTGVFMTDFRKLNSLYLIILDGKFLP